MLSCKEASMLLSQSLDQKLPLRKTISLKFHLMICYMCRRIAGQIGFIRQALPTFAQMEEEVDRPSDIRLSSEAKARIVSALTPP